MRCRTEARSASVVLPVEGVRGRRVVEGLSCRERVQAMFATRAGERLAPLFSSDLRLHCRKHTSARQVRVSNAVKRRLHTLGGAPTRELCCYCCVPILIQSTLHELLPLISCAKMHLQYRTHPIARTFTFDPLASRRAGSSQRDDYFMILEHPRPWAT